MARHLSHDWFPRPLPDNVAIGDGSWVYSTYAFLHCRAMAADAIRIGKRTGVYNGTFFDLGPHGRVHVGDYSTLVGVIIASNSMVHIGSYCFLAHEVVIADEFGAGPWRTASGRRHDYSSHSPSVVIEDDAWIGAGVVLLRGARIGAGAIVGAATVVDFEVPAHTVVGGNPARVLRDAVPASSNVP